MQQSVWRNKKHGTLYTLLYEAKHSETLERVIVYMSAKGEIWVRPHDLFFEKFEPVEVSAE
jgi:hypothetical protein